MHKSLELVMKRRGRFAPAQLLWVRLGGTQEHVTK
jgi:hypothetical protein